MREGSHLRSPRDRCLMGHANHGERTHPTSAAMLPTTRGFHPVHVQESANPRASKSGGIAYHHISDTYIALFTHFIPCGVWEAVYIIEGLLKNASELKPTTIHADTQGQSFMWTVQVDHPPVCRWSPRRAR
jgi:hypothetical protein